VSRSCLTCPLPARENLATCPATSLLPPGHSEPGAKCRQAATDQSRRRVASLSAARSNNRAQCRAANFISDNGRNSRRCFDQIFMPFYNHQNNAPAGPGCRHKKSSFSMAAPSKRATSLREAPNSSYGYRLYEKPVRTVDSAAGASKIGTNRNECSPVSIRKAVNQNAIQTYAMTAVVSALLLPATMLVLPSHAQESVADAPGKAQARKNRQPSRQAVLTNDNLDSLKGTISVVGEAPAPRQIRRQMKRRTKGKETTAADKSKAPAKDVRVQPMTEIRRKGCRLLAANFADAERNWRTMRTNSTSCSDYNLKQQQYYQRPESGHCATVHSADVTDFKSQMMTRQPRLPLTTGHLP